jgi:asparagine N-glycosylation enzyme membrane subunit Stt3
MEDKMKTFKVTLTLVSMVATLATSSVGQPSGKSISIPDYKSVSGIKAAQYSVMGALIPVTAGLACLKMDGPKTIPAVFILSGVFLGPSAGYFYGGCPERGATGILLRVGTATLTGLAAREAARAHQSDEFMDFSGLEAALTVGAIGSGIILIESIVDIALVKGVVEKKNIERARQAETNVTLLPAYFADSDAGGLELNITF